MFIMPCRQCGEKFEAKTPRRMYCSKRCIDKGKPSAQGLTCRLCGMPMAKGSSSRQIGEAAHNSCLRSNWEHGTKKGYVFHRCRCDVCRLWNRAEAKEYRQKRRDEGRPIRNTGGNGPYIPESLRFAVYQRDEWKCGLCGVAMEPTSDPQSDWFPSLDHIIPQSKGGDHTFENLRAAHRWCNSVRGDGRFHKDLFV